MAIKIDQKIVSYGIKKPEDETTKQQEQAAAEKAGAEAHGAFRREGNVVHMTETLERPDELIGSTYKVKPPVADHAMYITINDIMLNEGTDQEVRRPFEIFINSKNLDHYQWIVALTRVISAVFRKGGDVAFLVEELQAVFDPRGGYWKPGGKFMPSLIAEIGEVIERHLTKIGMIQSPELDEHQKKLIEQKRAEYEAAQGQKDAFAENPTEDKGDFPAGAQLCTKCNTAAVVMMDGCLTCLSCGDSKCG